MWAAANDTSNRRRHNRQNNKRSRKNINDASCNNSDYYSSSDDDEHSTTESISEGISNAFSNVNNNNLIGKQSSSANQSSTTLTSYKDTSHAPSNNLKRSRSKRRKHKQNQIGETAEATIARLKTTYSTAISAVGELHSVSRKYCKLLDEKQQSDVSNVTADAGDNDANSLLQTDDSPSNTPDKDVASKSLEEEAYQSLQSAANTARSTLESSLLLDSIILSSILTTSTNKTTQSSYAATTGGVSSSSSAWLDTYSSSSSNATSNNKVAGVAKKWSKLSKAHQSSIRQISYLILVNYADLLLSGIVGTKSDVVGRDGKDREKGEGLDTKGLMEEINKKGMDILDKGAVSKLDILSRLSSFPTPSSSPD